MSGLVDAGGGTLEGARLLGPDGKALRPRPEDNTKPTKAEAESVDLRQLLGNLAEAYETTRVSGEDAVRVVYRQETDGPLHVEGIPSRIGQVIRNLVDNAVTFSPPAGVVTISTYGDDDIVTITIDDQGPGIPEGMEKDIFARFYTERPANEAFGTHSGLGLSIAKQIVETFGGTITAANLHGAGGAVSGARFKLQMLRDDG